MTAPVILGTAVEIPTEDDWTGTAHILLEYALHGFAALLHKDCCKPVCFLQLEEEGNEIQSFYYELEISVKVYSVISKIRISHALTDPFFLLHLFPCN